MTAGGPESVHAGRALVVDDEPGITRLIGLRVAGTLAKPFRRDAVVDLLVRLAI
jgi:hypothetical protein